MPKNKYFKHKYGQIPYPVFFPDATRALVKSLDSDDIRATQTTGILVNTFHLWHILDKSVLEAFGGIREYMGWKGAVISDSGGFQVMSVVKKGVNPGKITDEGVVFYPSNSRKIVFTPEESVRLQMSLDTDMVVVLDDFTDPRDDYNQAKKTVDRTLEWAKRSKAEFKKICLEKGKTKENRPYLLGVVQGGEFMDLRESCTRDLVKIGFDGLGWGGWPIVDGKLNFKSAEVISQNVPDDYLLYGLGIGKPEDIIKCFKLGYNIFDCVLPTRDARHGRLYVFDAENTSDIDVTKDSFYHFFNTRKFANIADTSKVSQYCDCSLCLNYSVGYLVHLFKLKDPIAGRLASIHNLRFFSILMEKLQTTTFSSPI